MNIIGLIEKSMGLQLYYFQLANNIVSKPIYRVEYYYDKIFKSIFKVG